MLKFRVG